MQVYFSKFHVLGFDVVVIDNLTTNVFLSKQKIKKLSDRYTGIGFERLVILEAPYNPEIDFHYQIFDCQGVELSYCAVSSCVLSYFIRIKKYTNKKYINFSSNFDTLSSLSFKNKIFCNFQKPIVEPSLIPFKAIKAEKVYLYHKAEKTILYGMLKLDQPYCVVDINDLDKLESQELYKNILSANDRFIKPTHIVFIEILDSMNIKIISSTEKSNFCINSGIAGVIIAHMQDKVERNVCIHFGMDKIKINIKFDFSYQIEMSVNYIFDGNCLI